jgi:hypothetical protein
LIRIALGRIDAEDVPVEAAEEQKEREQQYRPAWSGTCFPVWCRFAHAEAKYSEALCVASKL